MAATDTELVASPVRFHHASPPTSEYEYTIQQKVNKRSDVATPTVRPSSEWFSEKCL